MRHKLIVSLSLIMVVISFCVYAAAGDQKPDYFNSSVDKAKQGVTNILTGWLELPFQVYKGYKKGLKDGDFKIIGGFFGIFRGALHGLGRTAAGTYQLATFPLPNPKDNQGVGVPLDGQYVWEEGDQYSIGADGTSVIGKKAIRGLSNTFFGIFDMPGQFIKGVENDRPLIGLGNSILYPLSRMISGVYDLGTVFLPNSGEDYGYPLEEEHPWDAFPKGKYYNELE